MSELDKAFGGLVEVMMDWERRLKDVEIALADFCISDQSVTRKAVEPAEWERFKRLEVAVWQFIDWLPLGTSVAIRRESSIVQAMWDALTVGRTGEKPVDVARLQRIEQAAARLLEFSRPMGDADRIKAWDALAKAVRGNGL